MDAILLSSSASLSMYLPRYVFGYQSRAENLSMTAAIGLSFGLFSLSILEAAPSAWLLFLSHDQNSAKFMNLSGGILTISRMYYVSLWALSILILFIFPALAGASLADSFRDLCCRKKADLGDDDKRKKKTGRWKQVWMGFPWWIRFTGGFVVIVTRNIWRLTRRVCLSDRSQYLQLPGGASLDVGRTRTFSDEGVSLTRVESADMEIQRFTKHSGAKKAVDSTSRIWMLIGGLIGVAAVSVVVGSVAPMVVNTHSGISVLSTLVSWLCAVGLLISSLLNGFGSVSMPYTCLVGLYLTPVRPEVIVKLEAELQSVGETMVKKRKELRELTLTVNTGSKTTSGASSSSSRQTFGSLGGEVGNRRQVLQIELDFLQNLCQDMTADIDDLRYSQTLSSGARTTMGKVRSYIGLLFSIILLARLGSASMSIWQSYSMELTPHKVTHSDVVTRAMAWLSGHHLVSQKDLTMLSQVVSLGLTAILSFSQARTFFRAMAVVHCRLSRFYQSCYCIKGRETSTDMGSVSTQSGLLSTLFSQVLAGATGCYFLSCIVLIKMMLPEDFCQDFAGAMGGMDVFSIRSSMVNSVFAGSAGVSLSIIGMLFGIQRQNTTRHTAPLNQERPSGHLLADAV